MSYFSKRPVLILQTFSEFSPSDLIFQTLCDLLLLADWSNFKLQHPHPKAKYKPVQKAFITGTKVNTRNLETYRTRGNEVERLDIRRDNYQRRQMQMECHGFNAKKERPYKGIGDPFYLDEDKLILHALGQLEEVYMYIWILYVSFCKLAFIFQGSYQETLGLDIIGSRTSQMKI